jgi:Mn-dependent DtxR family transcriptional regulator
LKRKVSKINNPRKVNSLITDHAKVLDLIYNDVNTNGSISYSLNSDDDYSDFIIKNLLKLEYIDVKNKRYVLTSKGNRIAKLIKNHTLRITQYYLIQDIIDYLQLLELKEKFLK